MPGCARRFESRAVVPGRRVTSALAPGRRSHASKLQPELHLGLMALEIGQVERTGNTCCAAGNLRAPGRDDPQAFRQPRIKRRAEKQRLPGEMTERGTLIGAQVAGFDTDENARLDLDNQSGGGPNVASRDHAFVRRECVASGW